MGDQLARVSEDRRFSTQLVGALEGDPVTFVRCLSEDIAPRLRELIG